MCNKISLLIWKTIRSQITLYLYISKIKYKWNIYFLFYFNVKRENIDFYSTSNIDFYSV